MIVERYIANEFNRSQAMTFIAQQPLPFSVTITDTSKRSIEQNRLQWLWFAEIAAQTGETPSDVQARCKLEIGVPLLREQNERFRALYDRILKPLPPKDKLALMGEPIALAVTSLMTVKQFTEYLERVFEHHTSKGYELTQPEIAEWR
jgi:hypothetical protein